MKKEYDNQSPRMSENPTKKKSHHGKKGSPKPVGQGKEIRYSFSGEKGSRLRKDAFVKELTKTLYNIKHACTQVGIDRRTYNRWKESDPEFERACEEIEEGILDEAEFILQQKITEKDTPSLLFFLKTKGKNRGYVERRESVHDGKIETSPLIPGVIIIEAPHDDEETTKMGANTVPCADKEETEEMPKPEVPDKVESDDTPQDTTGPRWAGH